MLRLRDTHGKSFDLPHSVAFVEVCDKTGNLAAVIHRIGEDKVAVYTPGDEEFRRYIATYHVTPTQVTKI